VTILDAIRKRKQRHIRLSLEKDVQSKIGTGLEDIWFIHRALPDIDLEEISTDIELLGKHLSAPLIISAITGGTEDAKEINKTLASAAENLGIGIGVGSQRIALENPSMEHTFRVVREEAPSALIMGNLGCPQLSLGWGVEEAQRCVDMISADALAIHMNPLQEAIQVEGETRYKGVLHKIREVVDGINVPVVMKETGCGIAFEDAIRLEETGVEVLDVSGAGGTSWAAVEHYIAREVGIRDREMLGEDLWNWGIPTAISVVEASRSTQLKIIASGGIRTGLDMAKAIALGADAVSLAKPLLEKSLEGFDSLRDYIKQILLEFQTVMFLVGAREVEELKNTRILILGRTAEWLRARGFNLDDYVLRSV
jgi:isopentenyl-diphosphate delta-isomerase